MMTERGVAVDHATIYRWVQHFAPEMERRRRCLGTYAKRLTGALAFRDLVQDASNFGNVQ